MFCGGPAVEDTVRFVSCGAPAVEANVYWCYIFPVRVFVGTGRLKHPFSGRVLTVAAFTAARG
jgi:hypothetical protein